MCMVIAKIDMLSVAIFFEMKQSLIMNQFKKKKKINYESKGSAVSATGESKRYLLRHFIYVCVICIFKRSV